MPVPFGDRLIIFRSEFNHTIPNDKAQPPPIVGFWRRTDRKDHRMRYAETHKAETRARVVEKAARALRREGVDGIGLVGLMAEAGLTKGGFYAHFTSKDELVAEAMAMSLQASAERMRANGRAAESDGQSALCAIVDAYLSPAHVAAPEAGCSIGALLSDLTRGNQAIRKAAADGTAQLVAAIEDVLPASLGTGRASRAWAIFAMLAGALQLARLQSDPDERDACISAGRDAALLLASTSL
jgi:TetR/AcrR family transcriptional repressor of nem operon